jgi:DsbC/DsbD-like thiol-disulfide interchange protein
MRRLEIILAGILCCLWATGARASHVQAELLADVSGIQPGKPFWLGVHLTIDPGWHVYWKNPGDTGLPTRVSLTLPDGFTAGAVQFPTPNRYSLPDKITAYGYENSVLILARVIPPDHLPADFSGNFQATVSWLVCAEECIPGKQALSLNLGTSSSSAPANRELFDQWTGQLPVDAAESENVATINQDLDDLTHSPKGFSIEITWKGSTPESVEFFPLVPDDYELTDATVESDGNKSRISFSIHPLAGRKPGAMTMPAVVGYTTTTGQRRGVDISVALPALADNNH